MARKAWESLTPAYRTRLERAGVNRSAYESGASLKAARGHSKTPEHGPKIEHITPKKYVREQWVIGKPGPRGGGRPTAKAVRQAIDKHIKTPDVIVTVSFLAPFEKGEDERLKRYKSRLKEDEEEEEEEEQEEEEEEEKPKKKPKKKEFPPPGQQVYTASATLNRDQFRRTMDTIAGLDKADQKAGMIQFAEQITHGQFSPISDVLTISVSNTKAKS